MHAINYTRRKLCTMSGLSIRTMIISYSILTVCVFLHVYLPLLASNQVLSMDDAVKLLHESQLPIKTGPDADNRHIISIVTGSTSGIGKEIAATLYSFGMTVVVASRNTDKCQKTMADIQAQYPGSRGALLAGLVDTGDLASVARFTQDFQAQHSALHLLVLNAGIHYVSSYLTPDGLSAMDTPLPLVSKQNYDLAFATNYLGHFLMAKMLTPTLLASGAGTRVLSVSSTYHVIADGEMLRPGAGGAAPIAARGDLNSHAHRDLSYGNNKLAQVLHAKESQRRLQGDAAQDLKFVSFCPGWVDTGILPENVGGRIVASLAFPTKAGVIGVIGGLFSSKIQGGEYVGNYDNIFLGQSWSDDFFSFVSRNGLRTTIVHALSVVVLFLQGTSYGFHIEEPSPEARDGLLAKSLFDWSDAEVSNYISKN